ncbi:SDR family oxidoreductase [Consotaella salsifontis]|uniref:Short-chain dehydrogenase n=1 Tax=Consotaella salsifontis TaxID=1365950 RepID=A0A1T4T595_9HYPH|nr:SDR family oxidoreductase [Consotaella salsifontis]SKA35616.1 Short-chain dehydrogenase [Consotaella salsifontis]
MATHRIALVTGANKGIGFEIAKQLAEAGTTVLLGARDQARGQAAVETLAGQGLDVSLLILETTDQDSIAVAAKTIEAEHGHLDILVNNVGIYDGADSVPSKTSIAVVRDTMETNFIGTLAVTQALLPLLSKSEAGRIVNLSSTLGSITCNGDPKSAFYAAQAIGYNASKAALNMLTVQLAQELRDSNIIVTSVCPGFVKTDLSSNMGNVMPDEAAKTPVRYALCGDDVVSGRFVDKDGEVPW